MRNWIVLILAAFLAPTLAHAIDGQVDVAPDGAVPFVISASGSYVLVKNVAMTTNLDCISITASNVTLDLNGHTLAGTGAGAGEGVKMGANNNISVRNGTIRNFGSDGISGTGNGLSLDQLIVSECRLMGVFLDTGTSCRVTNVTARENFTYGIFTGVSCRIENCVAAGNNKNGGFAGIYSGGRSVVLNCIANVNKPTSSGAAYGIVVGSGSTVQNCTASGNSGLTAGDGTGISAASFCTVANCVADANNGADIFSGNGITAVGSCLITGNIATENTGGASGSGIGITVNNDCVVSGNTCTLNAEGDTGSSLGAGIFARNAAIIIGNICRYNSSGGGTGTAAGIYAEGEGCTVRDNDSSQNHAEGAAAAYGIYVKDRSIVKSNTTTKNTSALGNAYGIRALDGCMILENDSSANTGGGASGIEGGADCLFERNVCTKNVTSSSNGTAVGISAGRSATIRSNQIIGNKGAGAGSSYGINAIELSLIENNNIVENDGGTARYGIRILGAGATVVRGNSIGGHPTAGIRIGTTGNRSEMNRTRDSLDIVAGNSLGTGDLADIIY